MPTPPPPPSSAGDNVEAAANTTSTTATTVEDGNVATTASSAASRMLEHELERLRQGKHGGDANPSGSAKSDGADSSDEASDEDGADDEDAGDEAGDDRLDDDETVNDDGTDGDADADAVKAPQPKVKNATLVFLFTLINNTSGYSAFPRCRSTDIRPESRSGRHRCAIDHFDDDDNRWAGNIGASDYRRSRRTSCSGHNIGSNSAH